MSTRRLTVAAAQMGPLQKAEGRDIAVARMVALMDKAARRGAEVVVFPELALTTFFPRWYHENLAEADHWYEHALPSNETAPLFDAARRLNIGFHLGYAEKTPDGRRFNTAVYVHPNGEIVLKYRKVHLPGHAEYDPVRKVQHLEKRYFEPGDLGFPVVRAPLGAAGPVNIGMMICNDRRWPEAWRVLGLQGTEMVMLGYNTPQHDPAMPQTDPLQDFHNHLSMQAGCYANGTWAVCVAKAGVEEGIMQIGGSCIIAPSGQIVAQALGRGDELVMAACDLDACTPYKETMFNFARHRRPEHYGMIVERTGSLPPD